jgi:hypothetical protein
MPRHLHHYALQVAKIQDKPDNDAVIFHPEHPFINKPKALEMHKLCMNYGLDFRFRLACQAGKTGGNHVDPTLLFVRVYEQCHGITSNFLLQWEQITICFLLLRTIISAERQSGHTTLANLPVFGSPLPLFTMRASLVAIKLHTGF